jgi:hypothetical protein
MYLDQSNYLANQQQVFGFVVPFTRNLPRTIKLFIQSTAGVWLCYTFYQPPQSVATMLGPGQPFQQCRALGM